MPSPTDSDQDELLLSCRYGDLEDIQRFVDQFGQDPVAQVADNSGNTVLHMAAGNGHQGEPMIYPDPQVRRLIFTRHPIDVLDYLLSIVPPSLLSAQNHSGSTPLHWATLNTHLSVVRQIVQLPNGPGIDLIDIKNAAGRSPLAEAEMVGWDEGAIWLVEKMRLDPGQGESAEDVLAGEDKDTMTRDIQVEIEDADGRIARMTINDSKNGARSASGNAPS
jgi:ankyrin repeat protein